MSPLGRPEGEYRKAQPGGSPMSPLGRPEGEYWKAQAVGHLHAAAQPLVALTLQLRQASLQAPSGLLRALGAAVEGFERELAAQGMGEREVAAASYVLCAWVDDVVADTPWAAEATPLLQRVHHEAAGQVRVLRLIEHLMAQPERHAAVLELAHACLCLGLQGEQRGQPAAAAELTRWRQRLHESLTRVAPVSEGPLSAPWAVAVPAAVPPWRRRAWQLALLLGALATLGVYTAAQLRLAAQVDAVFVSMQGLGADAGRPAASGAVPATPPVPSAPVARLAAALGEDVRAGRVALDEAAHRSTVSVSADRLLATDGAGLSAAGQALLERIAAALATQPGKIVVRGHTDGQDARDARLPSAWHQSFEWARLAAGALTPKVGADRVEAEGLADAADERAADGRPAGGAKPSPRARRRVDIVLFP